MFVSVLRCYCMTVAVDIHVCMHVCICMCICMCVTVEVRNRII